MINEQEKKAIFNGVLARTNNNKKAKFILKSEHEANFNYPYLFLISDKDKCYTDWYNEHLNSKQDKFNSSIVELWKDKPEPFDIERALTGEPVMLRNGLKAFVKFMMPKEYEGYFPLSGYIINHNAKNALFQNSWTLDGKDYSTECKHGFDIISMWKEPEPVSNTVTLTLPCPLKEPQAGMWSINERGPFELYYGNEIGRDNFNKRVYFGSKEDANAWFQAMQDSRR